MGLEAWPGLQAVQPTLDIRSPPPLDRQLVPAVYRGAGGNVRHGEAVAIEIVASSELRVEDGEPAFGELAILRDGSHVALLRHDADELEKGGTDRLVERRLLPVHPALGAEALLEFGRA